MYPWKALAHGASTYLVGFRWLKNHPKYFLLLFIPSFLGLIGVVAAGAFFLEYHSQLLKFFLFEPGQGWFWVFVYYLAYLLFHLTALVVVLLLGVSITNIVAAPVYEQISEAIERDLYPGQLVSLSFWQSLRLIPEEIKKALLTLILSLALFLIPGLNLLAAFGSAFLLAWDFYDYPFARRGLALKERIRHARQDFFAILGLSLWFLIPLVQVVLVPLAVVGATMLGLEKIKREAEAKR